MGREVPEWCLGWGPGRGRGSWEGEGVLGRGGASWEGGSRPHSPSTPRPWRRPKGGTVEKEGVFWAGLSRDLCSRAACPLNQNIPDDSRFLSPNSPEPVGAPVQEERCLTGCWVFTSVPWHPQPPEGGGGLHHTRAVRPWSDPSRSPCRHSPSRAWGAAPTLLNLSEKSRR